MYTSLDTMPAAKRIKGVGTKTMYPAKLYNNTSKTTAATIIMKLKKV
jgi:hypothetical protein